VSLDFSLAGNAIEFLLGRKMSDLKRKTPKGNAGASNSDVVKNQTRHYSVFLADAGQLAFFDRKKFAEHHDKHWHIEQYHCAIMRNFYRNRIISCFLDGSSMCLKIDEILGIYHNSISLFFLF